MTPEPSLIKRAPDKPLDQQQLQELLSLVLDRMEGRLNASSFTLVGTAAAVLRGVKLEAGDVDLLMKERRGVDVMSQTLTDFECVTPPTFLTEAKQYFAAFFVNGVQIDTSTVEWETDSEFIETFGVGPWKHRDLIQCGTHPLSTIAIELRLVTELVRQRADRYEPILEWLKHNPGNRELLTNAMSDRGIDQTLQQHVMNFISQEKQGGF